MRSGAHFLLTGSVLLFLAPAPSDGAIFPCDEAGFDQALAVAEGGDSGPHTFACATEDLPLVLTSGKSLSSSLTIDGEGQLVVQGLDVLLVGGPAGSLLELRNLTLIDLAVFATFSSGQGLMLSNASVTGTGRLISVGLILHDSVISDYHAVGGNLLVARSSSSVATPVLEILDSEISGSSAGAVPLITGDGAAFSIVSSVIRDNEAGDGILNVIGSNGTIESTTISGNESGGAIWADAGTTIENVTVSGNFHPPLDPGAVPNPWSASGLFGCATVRNSTFTGNMAVTGHTYSDLVFLPPGSGAVFASCSDSLVDGAPAVFENTILDGSCVLFDEGVAPTLPTSHGGNLETGGDTCGFTDPTDQVAVAPAALALGPLADNGGPTETHALAPGSVAQDAAVLANCPATDQRGAPRPEPGGTDCDAGSFELPEPEVGIALGAGAALLLALYARRRRRALRPAPYTSGSG